MRVVLLFIVWAVVALNIGITIFIFSSELYRLVSWMFVSDNVHTKRSVTVPPFPDFYSARIRRDMMPVWIENENRTKLEINETIDEEIGEKQGDFNQLNQLKTELDHNLTEQIRDMLFDGVDERDMEIFNDTSLSSQTIDDDGNVIISSETDDQTLTEMVETTTIGSVQTVTDVNEKENPKTTMDSIQLYNNHFEPKSMNGTYITFIFQLEKADSPLPDSFRSSINATREVVCRTLCTSRCHWENIQHLHPFVQTYGDKLFFNLVLIDNQLCPDERPIGDENIQKLLIHHQFVYRITNLTSLHLVGIYASRSMHFIDQTIDIAMHFDHESDLYYFLNGSLLALQLTILIINIFIYHTIWNIQIDQSITFGNIIVQSIHISRWRPIARWFQRNIRLFHSNRSVDLNTPLNNLQEQWQGMIPSTPNNQRRRVFFESQQPLRHQQYDIERQQTVSFNHYPMSPIVRLPRPTNTRPESIQLAVAEIGITKFEHIGPDNRKIVVNRDSDQSDQLYSNRVTPIVHNDSGDVRIVVDDSTQY